MSPPDLTRAEASGVYRVADPEALSRLLAAARRRRHRVCVLDLSGVTTKEECLRRAAATFDFPSYFGGNWDAFDECVNDLGWLPARGYVIRVVEPGGFAQNAPQEFATLISILHDAAAQWKSAGIPFIVLVEDAGNSTFSPQISPI
ncbi:MAG: barnase inhibitor [Azospira oryzae]|nr:MAG: barnase inhibitor [Azospira oryzae]PZP81563.1 MAG: barnase inhibitor [Azospira oryzae]